MDRKQIILSLRNKRYTYRKIGALLGISCQRVHQINTGYHSPFIPAPITCIPVGWNPINKMINGNNSLEGRDWAREQIRIRDNHTCQICGKVWKKGERRFDVHHRDCNKEKTQQFDHLEKEKDNMITLCHKCHLDLEEHALVMRNKH